MGDLEIECQEGSIEIEKIKGTNLQLDCGQGWLSFSYNCLHDFTADVTVKKVLEGIRSTIQAKNLKAKMLNGKQLSINCSGVADVEAIYSENTQVQAKGINIGLNRGVLKVWLAFWRFQFFRRSKGQMMWWLMVSMELLISPHRKGMYPYKWTPLSSPRSQQLMPPMGLSLDSLILK